LAAGRQISRDRLAETCSTSKIPLKYWLSQKFKLVIKQWFVLWSASPRITLTFCFKKSATCSECRENCQVLLVNSDRQKLTRMLLANTKTNYFLLDH